MRFSPPFTGNTELDSFLSELVQYVSSLDAAASTDTGTVGADVVTTLTFTKRYLHVKYAADTIGTGFSDTETGKLYFGLFNSDDPTESSLYYEYTWYPATFSTSNHLFYRNTGGRSIQLNVDSVAPDAYYTQSVSTAIDLDILSAPILDGTVTTSKIADDAVTADKIADNSIENHHMADDAIGLAELNTTGTPTSSNYLSGTLVWGDPVVPHVAAADPHTQYAKKAGDTFSGTVNFNGSVNYYGLPYYAYPITAAGGQSALIEVTLAPSQGLIPYALGFGAYAGALPTGSTVNEVAGFYVDTLDAGITGNYAFYATVTPGTGKYNFFGASTAENYFGGVTTFARTIVAPASATARAPLRIPHGTAPTTGLTNGDIWTTTAGLYARINGVTVGPYTTTPSMKYHVGASWSGGGSAVVAPSDVIAVPIHTTGTITKWTLLGQGTGSCTLSVWKDTYANYPPTVADNIAGSSPPSITAAAKATDSTLTGWTTAVTAGDILYITLASSSGFTALNFFLEITT